MNRLFSEFILATFAIVLLAAIQSECAHAQPATADVDLGVFEYAVEPAPEWTNLFKRYDGWFGADGIFSIPLDAVDSPRAGKETLLIFSDTWIGKLDKDARPVPGTMHMVNNTVAYIHGIEPDPAKIKFHYKQDADGKPQTYFVPDNDNAKPGQYYWLGDGFINQETDNTLYLFAYHVEKTGDNVFDFAESDVSLIAIPKGSRPPFDDQRQLTTKLHVDSDTFGEGNLGCGILVNTKWNAVPEPDGFIYVYGCIGKSKTLVAGRVPAAEFEDFAKWTFWNGESWSNDIQQIAAITDSVSNELSVTPLSNGRYLLVFQVMGLSEKIGMRIGASPVGPFGEIHEIYQAPEAKQGLMTYNAKAHPALSKPGELLISYNTITFDFWERIQKDGHIYRPRFIKLLFK